MCCTVAASVRITYGQLDCKLQICGCGFVYNHACKYTCMAVPEVGAEYKIGLLNWSAMHFVLSPLI